MISSTIAAGIINQTARGFSSFFAKSPRSVVPVAFSLTSSSTGFGDLLKTTTRCPPFRSRRAMLAPILPRPAIPICIYAPFSPSSSANLYADILKNVHKRPISMRNLGHGVLASDLLRPQVDEWIPETGPAHGETDEARNAGRRRQPFAHLFVIFAPAQNDATHFVPAVTPRGGHNLLAVLVAVKPLDLPHIRFDACVLQLVNGPDHQAWAKLQVILLFISLDSIELRLLRRDQQFKHESAESVGAQVFGQTFQAGCLPHVQSLIALRVVADQHLAESGIEGLDVFVEVFAVFELELLLAALLDRVCELVTARGRVAKDGGAELLVHQDARLLLWRAGFDRGLEAVVDDLLGGGDLRRLLRGQILPPSEHFQFERGAMIKGQDVQWPVIAEILHKLRQRRLLLSKQQRNLASRGGLA